MTPPNPSPREGSVPENWEGVVQLFLDAILPLDKEGFIKRIEALHSQG